MAAIYDKALKRKDFSGIVDKDRAMSGQGVQPGPDPAAAAPAAETGKKDKKDKKKAKKDKEKDKKDEPKAGADVGKIVNLMAGDANRVCLLFQFIERRLLTKA
jgi:ribosomal protein L12E/L44/L45/RPP1/RPP2